jgi:PAS domain S-box-containing protein
MAEKKKKLLLVEDESIIALAEKASLERHGYALVLAASGASALAIAEAEPDIDLVLMDINLGPGMDGTMAADAILKRRELPVVFLSSHTEPEIVEKTERITSYGYVVKNSGITVLDASIKMAFKLFEANQKLKATMGRLEATLDAMPDLLFEVGLDGYYYDVHAPQTELLVKPASDMVGKNIYDLLPPEPAGIVMSAVEEAHEKGRSFGKQYRLAVPAGERWFEISVSRIVSASDEPRFIFLARDITVRKHAEEALRESEARYRSLFQNAPVGIFYSTVDGKEISVNAEYARIMGYASPEELLHIVNQFTTAQVIFDHPEERAYLIDAALKKVGNWVRTEQRYKRKDGTHILTYLVFRALPEDPGVLEGFVEDINDRKTAEASLRSSEERLRNVITAANIGTWEWNVQTNEVKVDERSLALLGYEPGELPNLDMATWQGLKHPDDIEPINERLDEHLQGKTDHYAFESRMRSKSGAWVWILGRGRLVAWDKNDAPLRMYGIHMDITERRRAEEQVRSLLREKETILREVHHRIKNNMSVIQSLLNLQASSLQEPKAAAALEDAANRVQSMTLLYDKLYQSATFDAVSIRDYLSTLVDEIVGTFPGGASVRVEKNIEDFQLDVRRLQPLGIIVNELLTNIMKHAFVGRDAGSIEVSVSTQGEKVSIVVRDDGVGLPESIDFESATGFGLMLVQNLAAQIGGRIRLERGAGTAVVLAFDR